MQALNVGWGLRGSANQEIYNSSNSRFTPAEREVLRQGERAMEFQSRTDGVLQIGIPPRMGTKAILNVSAPAYKSQEVFTQVTQ